MFLRALLSRGFLINAVILGAAIVFWFYQLNKIQTKLDRLRSPENHVSLTRDGMSEIPDQNEILSVTDYQFLGQPFSKEGNSFQLLGPKNDNKENTLDPASLVIARSHILDGNGLREMICNSKGGTWYPADISDEDASVADCPEDTFSHPEYPDLNLADTHQIAYVSINRLSNFIYIFWAIIAVHFALIPAVLYWQIQALKKREAWTTKLENYDPNVLDQYPKAKRLCGLACSMLPTRNVDPNFDAAHKAPVKRPKLKRWGWKIGAVVGITVVGGALQLGTSYGLEQFLENRWAKLGVMLVFLVGINFAIAMAQSVKVAGIQEEAVQPGSRWAAYQKLPFFKYHDHVLKSLGMIEIGAFRQNGCNVPVVRTIYTSPTGNVLVEVGSEAGREFFTIESVINSGKFLETHSLCKPSIEKSDLLLRHQRRAASHEDILKALEDHDQFVSEFAGSGFNEAQFDEQKFPRFLIWGGEKKAT